MSRPITRGQFRDPVCADASAHEIAADVVAPVNPAGVSNWRVSASSADPFPRTAAARSLASCGQICGSLKKLNCETSRSL